MKMKKKKTEGANELSNNVSANELSNNSKNLFRDWLMEGDTYAKISDLWDAVKEDIKTYKGVYTFMIAVVFFVMRGYWYIYTWGHFDALKIDKCYLRSDGDNPIYIIIACVALGLAWIFLNYIMYNLIKHKMIAATIGTIFFEIFLLFVIACILTGVTTLKELFVGITLKAVLTCLLMLIWNVFLLNCVGIYFSICMRIKDKRKKNKSSKQIEQGNATGAETGEAEKKYNIRQMKSSLAFILITFGFFIYITGRWMTITQTSYKVIEQTNLESNADDTNTYIVLYETDEEYIVAPLYKENDKVIKEIDEQDVIPKQGIRTKYYLNIQNVGTEKLSMMP